MIAKRWRLSTDGGLNFDTSVTVANGSKVGFTEEENLKKGQVFLRRKLKTALLFTDADYSMFWTLRQGGNPCGELHIRQERFCNGGWDIFWAGVFAVSGGSFNHDVCTFEVKPEVFDAFKCLLENDQRKVNLMQIPSTPTFGVIIPSGIEFGVCDEGASDPPTECSVQFQASGGWLLAHTWVPFGGSTYRLYWREKIITQCVAGLPVPPPGTGWSILLNNCSGTYNAFMEPGTAAYVRNPTISYGFGDPQFCADPDTCCQPSVTAWYFNAEGYSIACLDPDYNIAVCAQYRLNPYQDSHFRVCLSGGDPIEYRGRPLYDCLLHILDKMGCGTTCVRSDFFEWNAIGNAPGYVPGFNYVTGEVSEVMNIMLLQKSDARFPTALTGATRGEMTFREFMAMILEMFDVLWDIDEDGCLRIEHYTFWKFPVGLDLVASGSDANRNGFESLSEEIPRLERLVFTEALNEDFIGRDIIYSGPCVQRGNADEDGSVIEHNVGDVTTDISYIATDPDAIEKSGFVLLATTFDGSDHNVIISNGALTGTPVTNAPLSTANLMDKYWRASRYMKRANMNGEDVVFDSFRPNLQQQPIVLEDQCCNPFNPKHRVRTTLGEQYLAGANGLIKRADYNDLKDTVTLTLVYAF